MDEGRLHDLRRLEAAIRDPRKSKATRQWADRTKKSVVQQLRDPKLRRLRERLIRAAAHTDAKEELKIANTIKHYLKQEQIEV